MDENKQPIRTKVSNVIVDIKNIKRGVESSLDSFDDAHYDAHQEYETQLDTSIDKVKDLTDLNSVERTELKDALVNDARPTADVALRACEIGREETLKSDFQNLGNEQSNSNDKQKVRTNLPNKPHNPFDMAA